MSYRGPMAALSEPDEYFLDPRAVRRSFDAAALTYDAAAAVQSEIRARLLDRLDVVRLQPRLVLDLGAGTGHASRALRQRYRHAQVVAMDISPGMLQQAARQQRWLRPFGRLACDAHRLALKDASVDLVFSNLMLQWCHDPDEVFREVRRVLRPGGLLMLTTAGPDTLKELRQGWRAVDPGVHVHRFLDMHDLGDALLRAGLAEPVMDAERLTVTYPSFAAVVDELRATGSRNIAQGRMRGLTSRGRLATLRHHAESLAREGKLSVSIEVVYGQAWGDEARASTRQAQEVRVPLSAIGPRHSSRNQR